MLRDGQSRSSAISPCSSGQFPLLRLTHVEQFEGFARVFRKWPSGILLDEKIESITGFVMLILPDMDPCEKQVSIRDMGFGGDDLRKSALRFLKTPDPAEDSGALAQAVRAQEWI